MPSKRSIFDGKPGGDILHHLVLLTRFYDWIDKIWLILSSGLVLLLFAGASTQTYRLFVLFAVYQCVSIGYGYAVNAYADLEEDTAAGKDRGVAHFGRRWLLLLYLTLAFVMLAIPFHFLRWDVAALGLVNLFVATFYSLPPVRFKERGIWAIIMAGIPQRSFVFLFLALLIPGSGTTKAILFAWLGLQGLIMEIGHQIFDYERDLKGGVRTWTVQSGPGRAKSLGLVLLAIFLFLCLLPVGIYAPWEGLMLVTYMVFFSTHSIYYFTDAIKVV